MYMECDTAIIQVLLPRKIKKTKDNISVKISFGSERVHEGNMEISGGFTIF